jgi:hypothetical protein
VTLILCRVSGRGHTAMSRCCNGSVNCGRRWHVAGLFAVLLCLPCVCFFLYRGHFFAVCSFLSLPYWFLCRVFFPHVTVYFSFAVFLVSRDTAKGFFAVFRVVWRTAKIRRHGNARFSRSAVRLDEIRLWLGQRSARPGCHWPQPCVQESAMFAYNNQKENFNKYAPLFKIRDVCVALPDWWTMLRKVTCLYSVE